MSLKLKFHSITALQNKVLSEAAVDRQTLSSLQLFEPTGQALDDSQSAAAEEKSAKNPDHFVTQDASLKFFLLITSWSCRDGVCHLAHLSQLELLRRGSDKPPPCFSMTRGREKVINGFLS
ncbi:hypothetical protein Q8A73_009648 [Channa argus]|nr:hypothetical protein Q8A73_009648 [Channa argus]